MAFGLAAEAPNLGADHLVREALALTVQAEQAASAGETLSLYPAPRGGLQEIVDGPPSGAAGLRVLGDRPARQRAAASAGTERLAEQEEAQEPVSEEGCADQFERIQRSQERCGVSLGEDDRLYLSGRALSEPIVSWGRPHELFLSPASPGGQYRIVDACGEMCGKAFVLDVQRNSLRDTFAGRYGPMKESIFWSPDGAYAVLAYEDQGLVWLYVVRASDGTSWEVLNEELVVRPESVRWLDTETFEVRALSCRGGRHAQPPMSAAQPVISCANPHGTRAKRRLSLKRNAGETPRLRRMTDTPGAPKHGKYPVASVGAGRVFPSMHGNARWVSVSGAPA